MAKPAYIKDKKETVTEEADSKVVTLAKELAIFKEKKETIAKEEKEVNIRIDQLESELGELMDTLGIGTFKVSGVGMFIPMHKNYPQVTDPDALVVWLDRNEMGNIAKRTVHHQTLVGLINQRLQDGESIPDGVNNFVKLKITVRRKG